MHVYPTKIKIIRTSVMAEDIIPHPEGKLGFDDETYTGKERQITNAL